jgi:hypothetical protein
MRFLPRRLFSSTAVKAAMAAQRGLGGGLGFEGAAAR